MVKLRTALASWLVACAGAACTQVLGIEDRELDGPWECYPGCTPPDCSGCTIEYHRGICAGSLTFKAALDTGYDGCRTSGAAACHDCKLCIEECLCSDGTKTETICAEECEVEADEPCDVGRAPVK